MLSQEISSLLNQSDSAPFSAVNDATSPVQADLDRLWQDYKLLTLQVNVLQERLQKAETKRGKDIPLLTTRPFPFREYSSLMKLGFKLVQFFFLTVAGFAGAIALAVCLQPASPSSQQLPPMAESLLSALTICIVPLTALVVCVLIGTMFFEALRSED